ncbi:MAG TPA: MFS transporter [Cellulomonas sp.]
MFGPYRRVLSRPGALAFSSAGVIARLPMSMVGIGIVLMIESLHGSYGLAGSVSAVYVLAQAVCSPQLARLVDQHGQARVMRPAVSISATALVALVLCAVLDAPVPTLYLCAIGVGATVGSFGALVRARWSDAVGDARELHTAYSLESALDEVVFVVGPVLATTLATGVAPAAGLVVPVVGMVLGGYWFLSQRATEPAANPRVPGSSEPRTSVMRSPGMIVLAVVFVAMGSIFGATDVATVAFAEEHGRPGLAGVILAVFAAGSMISGLLYGARHWVTPLWRRFAVGMAALAVGASLFVLVGSLPSLAVVMFVAGFAIAPTLVNGNALVQHFVPRTRLTEGLTWVGTSLGVGVSGGSSIAGVLIDSRGSHGGYLVVVGSAGLAVVAVLASLRVLRAGTASLSTDDGPLTSEGPTTQPDPSGLTTDPGPTHTSPESGPIGS